MMYANKMAVAIKHAGRVLREHKDTVYIPFSSEYSILLKNLNTVRAIVNVFIDGENVVPGGLILNVGQELDLERSIKNNNMNEGNKFKFIERTGAVENHRGVKLEDGIVRVEYQFEKVLPKVDWTYRKHTFLPETWPGDYYGGPFYSNSLGSSEPTMMRSAKNMASPLVGSSASMTFGATLNNVSSVYDAALASDTLNAQNAVENDAGITVAGSKSEQKFVTVSGFITESETHSIVLKLLGETASNKPVLKPVTVKAKQKCTTCGKMNKAHAKFCTECGTSLTIFA